MERVMESEDETAKRVYGFPTSQIRLRGRKSSYYDVVSSLEFDECNRALREVMERMDLEAAHQLVRSVPNISEFYCHMLDARYRVILEAPYSDLVRRGA